MTTTLHAIASDLKSAENDLALLERLNSAKGRVAQLTKDYAAAEATQRREEAERAKQAAEARFRNFDGIRVIDITKDGGGLLHRVYEITWKAASWDGMLGRSVMREHRVAGLQAVPSEALAYLVLKHPEQIPAAIMELAPGDPDKALGEYFAARRRGYTRGPVA